MNFEESITQLETIVKTLENGEISIGKSIEEFERGIKLVKELRAFLEEAEGRVNTLIEGMQDEKKAD